MTKCLAAILYGKDCQPARVSSDPRHPKGRLHAIKATPRRGPGLPEDRLVFCRFNLTWLVLSRIGKAPLAMSCEQMLIIMASRSFDGKSDVCTRFNGLWLHGPMGYCH